MNPTPEIDEFIPAISSLIAVLMPIIIYLNNRRSHYSQSKQLIDLLDTRTQLTRFLEENKERESIPGLKTQIEKLIAETDLSVKILQERVNTALFIGFITIEIFLTFNFFSRIILAESTESGFYFLQGIFRFPMVRFIGLLMLFFMSQVLTYRLVDFLRKKISIKKTVSVNLLMICLFNVLFICIIILLGTILALIDNYVSWF